MKKGVRKQPPGCDPGKTCFECPVSKVDCIFTGKQTKYESEMLERSGIEAYSRSDSYKERMRKHYESLFPDW